MKAIIGTSGYSYEDWRGVFYPEDIPKGKMLDFYAQHFSAVEINSTYYRIPHPAVFAQMEKKTPPGFEFIVKTNSETTHQRTKPAEAMKRLIEAVRPLVEAGKFAGFLAQFPYSFKNTPQNREYLAETRALAQEYPLFVEFRNWTWENEAVTDFLRANKLYWVNVDQPALRGLLHPGETITGDKGYIRFHGRNSQSWWKGTNQTRYDYLYSPRELEDWMVRIAHILKKTYKTYIFFNNHPQGKAIRNARQLQQMLDIQFETPNNLSDTR